MQSRQPRRPDARARGRKALVDTGSERAWIDGAALRGIGTIDEIVFAEPGDLQILGARPRPAAASI